MMLLVRQENLLLAVTHRLGAFLALADGEEATVRRLLVNKLKMVKDLAAETQVGLMELA